MIAEAARLEVRNVESLLEHYAITLRHWIRQVEAQQEDMVGLAGGAILAWRLFTSFYVLGFDKGRANFNQALLAKSFKGKVNFPLCRSDHQRSCEEVL
jgi:cyclopropane-fatty-acyl-phospholipid synthase